MPDTTLVLGDFEFARFEIPEQIGFGGEQKLNVHELIGGTRIIDAMGEVPAALEWSGFFVGINALDRALYLDGLRKAGRQHALSWSALRYTVIIRRLECQFQRFYRLPYRITCEVVSDDTTPVADLAAPSPEQLIGDDLGAAGLLADVIGDEALSGLMAGLSTAVSVAGALSVAAPSAIRGILQPLAAVQSRVGVLLGSAGSTIDGAPTVGGIIAGGLASSQVAALATQAAAVAAAPALLNLEAVLGRMQTNLGSFYAGQRSITAAAGDLFTLAAREYGDPRGWTAIAEANGLADPVLTGISTLQIPPLPAGADGILNG